MRSRRIVSSTRGRRLPTTARSSSPSEAVTVTSIGSRDGRAAVRAAPEIAMDPPIAGFASSPGGGARQWRLRARRNADLSNTAWVNDSSDVSPWMFSARARSSPGRRAPTTRSTSTANYDTFPAGQTTSCVGIRTVIRSRSRSRRSGPSSTGTPCCRKTSASACPHTWVLAHRRELSRRADGPSVLQVHRDALPQRRHHRLRWRRLLPRQSRHARADGRLPPEVEVRLGPHPAAVHGHRLHRRSLHGRHVRSLDRGARGARRSPAAVAAATIAPATPVTRQQMAVFLLKALEGSTYVPLDCTGHL